MADTVIILSKSPCQVKKIISIEFEKHEIPRDTVRNCPLFQEYFDRIWRDLQDEKIINN